ncbi:hypothetical protein ABN080_12320 [Proteus sp. fly-1089]|uniref:hypothetical protein n=1 Tax=Proteus sp. fly-1089 TaxID=3136675 RepID=UPI0032DB992D
MAQGTFYRRLNGTDIAGVLSVPGKRISASIRWTILDIGILDAVIDSEFSKAI